MIEPELLEKLKNADEAAFRFLVEKYQDKVFNTCLGFLRNVEEAEDLAQEVFIELYESIHSFRGEAKVSTFLYRIAVTKSLDYLRKQKRQKRLSFVLSLFGLEDQIQSVGSIETDHPGVLLENKERTNLMFSKIDELPERQRVAFSLHKIDGLSYQEIAEVMELSISSIESLIFRAKQSLQKKLKQYYETEK
ncbi:MULTISPECIES: RNA polymerase sigma factor [unclassified Arcicella]|uniref:RNA polymerase sigma factor n=1 Tax=unclassified Arcicella TaxID=2644986 RepID=UPI002862BBAF|nr:MULTISPECIES: RNA polymerase sigma factor [unclassified Arcicella]MDR6559921.1 RNA polymerase sigma-70 factor (ECF subfamily) [Arcicella sp. BE51]MDR6810472.1 RNA polymerase sigma-70 factor (ECF subfamily) [Arcicella sp. BE140]MDR6821822.1 RNA polymerase sigma-70 factor (ECF subfamily) [Arcicella sp. BE139]